MALDSSMLESSPPNRRFVAKLEPGLDVPILAASEIYRHLGMQLPQEFKIVTYDMLLVSEGSALSPPDSTPQIGRRKRRNSVSAVDAKGEQYTKHHNYTFQAFESVAGRTIHDLPFSHPRQLADIIPVCTFVWFSSSILTELDPPAVCFTSQLGSENIPPPCQQTGQGTTASEGNL
jgi:hypothetical protein